MKRGFFLLWLLPCAAHADAVQRLQEFYQSTTTLRAQFHQTVLDSKGRKVQEVTGSMQLQRPGRFRWDYHQPYVQVIVGDGKKVWLYDPDLNQVTVRSQDLALGASPAALLAGDRDPGKRFDLRPVGRQGDLEWVEVGTTGQDSGISRVLFGFREAQLEEMELHDHFGQTTVIVLSRVESNPRLEARDFRFVPPRGADVISE